MVKIKQISLILCFAVLLSPLEVKQNESSFQLGVSQAEAFFPAVQDGFDLANLIILPAGIAAFLLLPKAKTKCQAVLQLMVLGGALASPIVIKNLRHYAFATNPYKYAIAQDAISTGDEIYVKFSDASVRIYKKVAELGWTDYKHHPELMTRSLTGEEASKFWLEIDKFPKNLNGRPSCRGPFCR